MSLTTDTITIRSICETDNAVLAGIIRNSLEEFGANKSGTVYYDASTDALFELFQTPKAFYFVATAADKVLGGGGIYPTDGLPAGTCELVKMYLAPEARGIGLGRLLIETCLQCARDNGFKKIYIETMPELQQAVSLYKKFGFNRLQAPMGNSGHNGCNLWMIKEL